MDPQNQQNQTQLRRYKGTKSLFGKLIKGGFSRGQVRQKIQQILTKNDKIQYNEKNKPIFGNATQKFYIPKSLISTNIPGPGYYQLNKNIQKINSVKGSGFFASITKLSRLENNKKNGPGPGSYRSQYQKQYQNKKYIKKNQSTINSYRSVTLFNSQMQDRGPLWSNNVCEVKGNPGIGTYTIDINNHQRYKRANASFKSKVNRFDQNASIAPPVGCYGILSKSQPNLRGYTKRRKSEKKRDENELQKQKRIKNKIKNLYKKQQKKIGPGTYQLPNSNNKNIFQMKQSMHDRFGQLKPIYKMVKYIQLQTQNNEKMKQNNEQNQINKLSSIFRSKTQRNLLKSKYQLGPGQYQPKILFIKKSHLLNVKHQWV